MIKKELATEATILYHEKKLLSIIRKSGQILTSAKDINAVTDEKGGDSTNMVTAYDVAVQNFLIKEISAVIPDAFFFAEEKENNPDDLNRKYCFVIDPIDGTANFVHGRKKSSVSVALFSHGEVVFAAVFDPYLNEMFHAEKGKGSFLNGEKITVSDTDMPHALVAFGTTPYYKETLAEKCFSLAYAFYRHASDIRRSGSAAIDLAYLAAGRNDIFFELMLSPWDIAAGSLLITEAGGSITDFEGKPIDFSKPSPVFAATSKLYNEALKIAQDSI